MQRRLNVALREYMPPSLPYPILCVPSQMRLQTIGQISDRHQTQIHEMLHSRVGMLYEWKSTAHAGQCTPQHPQPSVLEGSNTLGGASSYILTSTASASASITVTQTTTSTQSKNATIGLRANARHRSRRLLVIASSLYCRTMCTPYGYDEGPMDGTSVVHRRYRYDRVRSYDYPYSVQEKNRVAGGW